MLRSMVKKYTWLTSGAKPQVVKIMSDSKLLLHMCTACRSTTHKSDIIF